MSAPYGAGSDSSNSDSDIRNFSFTVPTGVTTSSNLHAVVTSEDDAGELPSFVEIYLDSGGSGSGQNLTYIDGQVLEDGTDNMLSYYALDNCPYAAGAAVTVSVHFANNQQRRNVAVFFTDGYSPESVVAGTDTIKNSSGSGDCAINVSNPPASSLLLALYNTGGEDTLTAVNCTQLINDPNASMALFVGYVDPAATTNNLPATGATSRSTAMVVLVPSAGGTAPTLLLFAGGD